MSADRIVLQPVKTCLNCQGEMRPELGDLTFERGGLVVTVEQVPVSVCSTCGERYVPGPVGIDIGDMIDKVLRYFEESGSADAVAQPRALVLKASERVAHFAGV